MIDPLVPADAEEAAALSAAFGWPHRAIDWAMFLRLGQGVAWREHGRLAGTALWFPLDPAHAAIGLVQVAPALQGRGIGRHLMQAVMEQAGGRNLLLHATTAGTRLYEALGFTTGGRIMQWQGNTLIAQPNPAGPVRPAVPKDRDAIARLDQAATGLSRGAILDALMQESQTAVLEQEGQLTGYAMRRRFGRGWLIGPLVAANEAEAIALVAQLRAPGFVRLDITADSTALSQALAAGGLACAGQVQAMTHGPWPQPGAVRCFGLASQALG